MVKQPTRDDPGQSFLFPSGFHSGTEECSEARGRLQKLQALASTNTDVPCWTPGSPSDRDSNGNALKSKVYQTNLHVRVRSGLSDDRSLAESKHCVLCTVRVAFANPVSTAKKGEGARVGSKGVEAGAGVFPEHAVHCYLTAQCLTVTGAKWVRQCGLQRANAAYCVLSSLPPVHRS